MATPTSPNQNNVIIKRRQQEIKRRGGQRRPRRRQQQPRQRQSSSRYAADTEPNNHLMIINNGRQHSKNNHNHNNNEKLFSHNNRIKYFKVYFMIFGIQYMVTHCSSYKTATFIIDNPVNKSSNPIIDNANGDGGGAASAAAASVIVSNPDQVFNQNHVKGKISSSSGADSSTTKNNPKEMMMRMMQPKTTTTTTTTSSIIIGRPPTKSDDNFKESQQQPQPPPPAVAAEGDGEGQTSEGAATTTTTTAILTVNQMKDDEGLKRFEEIETNLKKTSLTDDPCLTQYCARGHECVRATTGAVAAAAAGENPPQESTAECICQRRCSPHKKVVCGTDGMIYENHCELHRTACILKRPIGLQRIENCIAMTNIQKHSKMRQKKNIRKHLNNVNGNTQWTRSQNTHTNNKKLSVRVAAVVDELPPIERRAKNDKRQKTDKDRDDEEDDANENKDEDEDDQNFNQIKIHSVYDGQFRLLSDALDSVNNLNKYQKSLEKKMEMPAQQPRATGNPMIFSIENNTKSFNETNHQLKYSEIKLRNGNRQPLNKFNEMESNNDFIFDDDEDADEDDEDSHDDHHRGTDVDSKKQNPMIRKEKNDNEIAENDFYDLDDVDDDQDDQDDHDDDDDLYLIDNEDDDDDKNLDFSIDTPMKSQNPSINSMPTSERPPTIVRPPPPPPPPSSASSASSPSAFCSSQEYEIMKDNLLLFNHEKLMSQNNNHSKDFLVSIMFSHYDQNNNGHLDGDELAEDTRTERIDQLSNGCTLADMLFYDDLNHDRILSVNEFYQAFNKLYSLSVVSLDKSLEINQLAAYIGDNVEIKCDVMGTPTPPIIWQRYGVDVEQLNENEIGVLTDGSLYLRKIQLIHTGNWTCHAQRNKDIIQTHILTVYTLPEVRVMPRIQTKKPGDSAEILCHVNGEPFPSVDWFKNDKILTYGGESGRGIGNGGSGGQKQQQHKYEIIGNGTVLKIYNINYSDTGSYKCQASNIGGIVYDISTFIVHDDPMASLLTDDQKFFVFHEYGIAIYEPSACHLHHQIIGTDRISQTNEFVCNRRAAVILGGHESTSSTVGATTTTTTDSNHLMPDNQNTTTTVTTTATATMTTTTTKQQMIGSRTCIWGRAINVGDHLVYATQPLSNRILVISTIQMAIIDIIRLPSNKFPVELFYVAAFDQLWILNWNEKSEFIQMESKLPPSNSILADRNVVVDDSGGVHDAEDDDEKIDLDVNRKTIQIVRMAGQWQKPHITEFPQLLNGKSIENLFLPPSIRMSLFGKRKFSKKNHIPSNANHRNHQYWNNNNKIYGGPPPTDNDRNRIINNNNNNNNDNNNLLIDQRSRYCIFKYGYVTTTTTTTTMEAGSSLDGGVMALHKIDLEKFIYVKSIDLSIYGCHPFDVEFSTLYGIVIVGCQQSQQSKEPGGQLTIDYLTDVVIAYKPSLNGRTKISPDSRLAVTIDHQFKNDTVKLIIQQITVNGLRFLFDVKTTLNISDITFYRSQTVHGFDLYASSTDKEDILYLNLFTGKVEIISGVGPIVSPMSTKWNNPIRPIQSSGMYGQFMVTPTNNALFVINGRTKSIKCEIGGVSRPLNVIWINGNGVIIQQQPQQSTMAFKETSSGSSNVKTKQKSKYPVDPSTDQFSNGKSKNDNQRHVQNHHHHHHPRNTANKSQFKKVQY